MELSGFMLLVAWPVVCTDLELLEIWASEPAGLRVLMELV